MVGFERVDNAALNPMDPPQCAQPRRSILPFKATSDSAPGDIFTDAATRQNILDFTFTHGPWFPSNVFGAPVGRNG